MHFCSVLQFAKANHNRATLCLSIAHLLCSGQFFAITTSFYSVPLLYFATPFHVLPIRIFALPYFANALHFFTTHCSAALFLYLTMRNLSLLCQNVSTLFNSITLPFCTSQYHSDTLLCYASPKQIITQQFCTFALPIITTISHAVAYSVISVHLKRPLPEFRH
nr:MAG TPA: hypothetical protein [Caudoviricetes sp.]